MQRLIGILRQLMQVDDVRQRAQLVQRLEAAAALAAQLEARDVDAAGAEEEGHRQPGFDGLQHRGQRPVVGASVGLDGHHQQHEQQQRREQQHRRHEAQAPDRPADRRAALGVPLDDRLQLVGDRNQARVREAFADAALQSGYGADEVSAIEL